MDKWILLVEEKAFLKVEELTLLKREEGSGRDKREERWGWGVGGGVGGQGS